MKRIFTLCLCALIFLFSCDDPQINNEEPSDSATQTTSKTAELKGSQEITKAEAPVSEKPMNIGTSANDNSKKEMAPEVKGEAVEKLTKKEEKKKKDRLSTSTSGKKKRKESKRENKKKSSKDLLVSKKSDSDRDLPMELKKTSAEGTPVATFSSTIHDFGFIAQGEKITHDFVFTNTGTADIEILNVDVTCGCTVPTFPFIPIAPGEKGTISVTYNSTGKLGNQKPMITIITNAQPRTYKLYFKGVVDADRAKPDSTNPKKN